jgi:hypothetical protein
MLPGVAPQNDGQLIRSLNDRISKLEQRTKARVGSFVLADVDGVLTAFQPGAEPFQLGATADFSTEIQQALSSTLSGAGYVTASQLAKALGGFGTSAATAITGGADPANILSQIEVWANDIVPWLPALEKFGVTTATEFVQLLAGLPSALVKDAEGQLTPLIDGFVKNANGTWQFVKDEAGTEVNTLIQQADGTIITANQLAQHLATAATNAGVGIGQAAVAGQKVVDQGIATLTGDLVKAGKQAEDHAAAWGSAFANWASQLTSNPLGALASGIDFNTALGQSASSASGTATLAGSINSQLPSFYGGVGTAGTSVNEKTAANILANMIQVAFPDIRIGMLHGTAAVTMEQEVSGVWNAADHFPKYLVLRSTIDGQTFVYCKLQTDQVPVTTWTGTCEIGYYLGGVKQPPLATFSIGVTGGVATTGVNGSRHNFVANSPYSFSAIDWTYRITGPNGLDLSIIDTAMMTKGNGVGDEVDPTHPVIYVHGGFGHDGQQIGAAVEETKSGATWTIPATVHLGDFVDIIGNGGFTAKPGQWQENTFQLGDGTLSPGDVLAVGFGANSVTTISNVTTSQPLFVIPPGNGSGIECFNGGVYVAGATAAGSYTGTSWFTPWTLSLPGNLTNFSFFDCGPSQGPAVSQVDTLEGTTATSPVFLPTLDQVTVNIGPSGMAIVLISMQILNGGTHSTYAMLGMSGANALTPALGQRYQVGEQVPVAAQNWNVSGAWLIPNLNPGATEFFLMYQTGGTNTGQYSNRALSVIPL